MSSGEDKEEKKLYQIMLYLLVPGSENNRTQNKSMASTGLMSVNIDPQKTLGQSQKKCKVSGNSLQLPSR